MDSVSDQQGEEEAQPALSLVIACLNREGLEPILAAFGEQGSRGVEIIVVSAFELAPMRGRYAQVRFLTLPPGSLAPRLWGAGIEAARGRLAAITTSHFLPAPDYAVAAVRAHERSEAAGIGGRIGPPTGLGPTAWAVYLLRYSAYLGQGATQQVEDFAGDNGVYKKASLIPYSDWIRERGFWEHEIHQLMRGDGARLDLDPSIEVRQVATYPFFAFVRQRLSHGCLYGEGLGAGRSVGGRIVLACRGALVPGLLVYRVARRVVASKLHRGEFVSALPAIICFASAWGLGESLGSLRGRSAAIGD